MKLLIVDDEELTRTGVISSIDWTSLGIDTILQADDGLNGLEEARRYRPEIILCDVRMPRMDGIAMLERIEAFQPDTVAIFMSGYSDIKYLKAAIKLKAINYIEKPLDPSEIREAILDAKEQYLEKQRSHRGAALRSMEAASRLAMKLTAPYSANGQEIAELISELSLKIGADTAFTAFIVKQHSSPETTEPSVEIIQEALTAFLAHFGLSCICAEKKTQYTVCFVFGSMRSSPETISAIGSFLQQQYLSYSRCFVVAGDMAVGLAHAYRSYESAVILMQNSFFFPEHTFLTSAILRETAVRPAALPETPEITFGQALTARNRGACMEFLEQLRLCFDRNRTSLQNYVKDMYYKLFLTLADARKQLKVTTPDREGSILEDIELCFNFKELHLLLTRRTSEFFDDAEQINQENPTIFLIKEYIGSNYGNESLSVRDISAHVYMSTSYVCTFFKNETGQTLNQYLTEYRMERAKELLADPRYKISEISSRVGYSDGNYFGKSFKKYSGLSPSEYREKMVQR